METEMVNGLSNGTLPRLPIIRRVPTRYSRMLPLTLMKQWQCTVVGAARGVLTVAISDSQQVATAASLEIITGQRIFFVLVDPPCMRLLISRLERYEHQKCREALGRPFYLHRLQLHAFILFLHEHRFALL
jgi:hypothetical protein